MGRKMEHALVLFIVLAAAPAFAESTSLEEYSNHTALCSRTKTSTN